MADLHWTKGCGDSACVEVARSGDEVVVRNSGDPGGPSLSISRARFEAFIADIKAGAPVGK
jgi:uncharacterized protein DUF397